MPLRLPTDPGAWPLIGPAEPPPFELLNPGGRAPVLLVADHASNRIPAARDRLGLTEAVLERHVTWDIGTRAVVAELAARLDAPAVAEGYSRLLVDLNRSLEDPTAMPEVSDGIVIPGNRSISARERRLRVQSFYTPYRRAIEFMLHRQRRVVPAPALVAIHSFTPVMEGRARPWQIGVLWDKDPRIPVPLMEALRRRPEGLVVGDNEPYSGRHPADYTIDHHAEAAGLPHVSIEVRQDLVDTGTGACRWAALLADALQPVLADPALYRLWEGP